MSLDAVILESPTFRRRLGGCTEALDRVKPPVLLPDGLHMTARMVADYYEVGVEEVAVLARRHRAELTASGMTPSVLTLFPRRAVLTVGMLLRGSEVARRVRDDLLEAFPLGDGPLGDGPLVGGLPPAVAPRGPAAEFRARRWKRWDALRWSEHRTVSADPAAGVVRPAEPAPGPFAGRSEPGLGPRPASGGDGGLRGRLEERLAAVDRRLDAHGRTLGTVDERAGRHGDDLRAIRRELLLVRRDLARLRAHRRR
ncbi:hypothetical protein [Kitasatospora camelliae]|uniref:Uncharacterized protein n=1 Tax=Kitasatospora camelliae TaxID=3156397 RepID=A0AAU8JZZ0_9ACTN